MRLRRNFLKLLAFPLLALTLPACSALGAFNSVVPKDAAASVVGQDIAYGPLARQKLDIYAPAGDITPAGIVVFVYGGSWNSGSKEDYGFAASAFAAKGYVTIVFDYRLVPQVRYPSFVEDTAKALAWAHRHRAEYGVERGPVYLVGHSAGAYNAMMVALAPEFLARENLSPAIIGAVAGLSGPYDFLPLQVDSTRAAFAGVTRLADTQPVNRVSSRQPTPPVLLLHGAADELVLPRNSAILADRLQAAGHDVEARQYAGAGHVTTLLALSRPLRKTTPVLADILRFFSVHGVE